MIAGGSGSGRGRAWCVGRSVILLLGQAGDSRKRRAQELGTRRRGRCRGGGLFAGLCSCQALLRRGCVGELLLVVVVATRRPQREGRLHGVAASRCRASRALALAGVGGSSGSGRGMVEFECPLAGGVVGARSNTWARCVACWSAADQDGGLRAGPVARSTRREGQSWCECLAARWYGQSARRLRAQMGWIAR